MIRPDGTALPPPLSRSSSSTLSPLAPPFTVDRSLPAATATATATADPSPPPPGGSGWSLPSSSSLLDPRSDAFASASAGGGVGAAFYSPVHASVGSGPPRSVADAGNPLMGFEGYAGMDGGPWKGGTVVANEAGIAKGVDGGASSVDPLSRYGVSSFFKGGVDESSMPYETASAIKHGKYVSSLSRNAHPGSESSEWLDNKHQAICDGKYRAPFNISGAPITDPSAAWDRYHYSWLPDITSTVEACKNFNFDLSNAKLVSCSTDSLVYNPATTYSSAQLFALPADRTICSTDSTSEHANPYRINLDFFNFMPCEQKEPSINRNAEGGHAEITEDSISVNSLPTKKVLVVGNLAPAGNSVKHSAEVKSGSRIAPSNLPYSFITECGSINRDSSMQTSSDPLDQRGLAVDSPCWKGAPASHPYLFGEEKIDSCPVVNDTEVCSNVDRGQEHLTASVQFVETPPSEHFGSLNCDDLQKRPYVSFTREYSSLVGLPNTHHKIEDAKVERSDCLKVSNEKCSQFENYIKEQQNEATEYLTGVGPMNNDVKQLVQVENAYSAKQTRIDGGMINPAICHRVAGQDTSSDIDPAERVHVTKSSISGVTVPGKNVEPRNSSYLKGSCSTSGRALHLLVKAMHSLSELFLSTYYSDINELKEDDSELLQLVVDNLKSFAVKNKQSILHGNPKESTHVSGLGAAPLWAEELNADDGMKKCDNKTTHGMKGKRTCICLDMNHDNWDGSVSKGIDNASRSRMTQALNTVLRESSSEQEEDPQTLSFKNLWIEAEVALCSMKYELQQARMKVEMENRKSAQRAHSHNSSDVEGMRTPLAEQLRLNSMRAIYGQHEPRYKGMENHQHMQEANVGGIPEQFTKILNQNSIHALDRFDEPRYKSKESSPTSNVGGSTNENTCRKPHEIMANSANEVDASVMDRFRVLKRRIDNSISTTAKEHPKVLDSVDAGLCLGTKESSWNLRSDGKISAGLNYLPSEVAGLGFLSKTRQPYIDSEPSNGISVVACASSFQHLNGGYGEEKKLQATNSEDAKTKEPLECMTGGSMVSSYVPSRQCSHFHKGESGSSSSEWEHVLKDDDK